MFLDNLRWQKAQRWGCLTPWLSLENKEWSTIWLTDVDYIWTSTHKVNSHGIDICRTCWNMMDVEIMMITFSNHQCSVHVSYLHFGRILESRFVILSVLSLKAVWCPPIPSRLPVKTVDISNPLVGDIQCLLGNKHRKSKSGPSPDMWQDIYCQCFFRWPFRWVQRLGFLVRTTEMGSKRTTSQPSSTRLGQQQGCEECSSAFLAERYAATWVHKVKASRTSVMPALHASACAIRS